VAKIHESVQVGSLFVVIPTILLAAVEPMLEGVVERCMHSATKAEFVESMGCVQVCPE
jgi:hypothetical protein